MSEWKTIDSAPKDGTRILLCCMKTTEHTESKLGLMAVDGWDHHLGWARFNKHHWPPTHWMPLPPPPSTT